MDLIIVCVGVVLIAVILGVEKGIEKAITSAIGEIPKRMHDIQMEELKSNNSMLIQKDQQLETRDLQVDNYYRSISGKTIEELFGKWANMIADTEKIKRLKPDELNSMIKELMMYGSSETVRIGAIFMQYLYRGEVEKHKDNPFFLLYLGSKLVASLKKDFTGYNVDPEDFIRMKIKDAYIGNKEQLLSEAKIEIERICKDGF